MKLEDIGFYTLSNARAKCTSMSSSLMRCELILTDKCNFHCPYCRGLRSDIKGTKTLDEAKHIVDLWASEGLHNVRFSGGEPTVWPGLLELVQYTKAVPTIEHIALSTNGSAPMEFYNKLVDAGVNDFSISLDACCASDAKEMAGGVDKWDRIVESIRELSKRTYVTVGVVVTESTLPNLLDTIEFAHGLGVADIRIISAAQYNKVLDVAVKVPQHILAAHPILRYRINNIIKGRNVRGLTETDSHFCSLVLDDMAIAGNYHFPCIIYMREGGDPVGKVGPNMREERFAWMIEHDPHLDPICSKNCLDVCIDYNNAAMR